MIYDILAQVAQQGEFLAIKPTLSVSQSFLSVCMSSLVTVNLSAIDSVSPDSIRRLLPYIAHHSL